MTTEKICFRYDDSEKAKQCIEWINETLNREFLGDYDVYYLNTPIETAALSLNKPTTHRLVTPAEFLRLVSEPEWTPKHGEEVEVSDDGQTWRLAYYCCSNPHPQTNDEYPHVVNLVHTKNGGGGAYRHIRPIRKSVREELIAMLWGSYDAGVKAEQILSKFNVTPKH